MKPPEQHELITRVLSERTHHRDAEKRAFFRCLRPHESVLSLLFGVLAMGLSVSFAVVVGASLSGKPAPSRTEMIPKYKYKGFRDGQSFFVYAGQRAVPSDTMKMTGLAGLFLGLAGLGLSYRRRQLSWLALFAVILYVVAAIADMLFEILFEVPFW
jgi:hypothetical protein